MVSISEFDNTIRTKPSIANRKINSTDDIIESSLYIELFH